MKKAFIYARVSTEEQAQEGKSIETQQKICFRWAKDNEYTVIDTFIDEGKSATTLNRPALKELLARCQEVDEVVDVILVQDTDRLARNTLNHLTIKSILKKKNIEIVSISQPMLDDSPEGVLMDTMIASFNAFQSQITGRKTSKVLEEKAKLGWFPGGTPTLGYKNIPNPSPTCTLDRQIINFEENVSPLVKKAFGMYATGNYNAQQIADYLNEHNIKSPLKKTLHPSYVARMLQNSFYIGKFMWNNILYEGKQPALISEDLFMQVQKVLEAHNHNATRKRKHSFLLRGFLHCAICDRRMNGEQHTKLNGTIYNLYFCPQCKKDSYVDKDKLENQVLKLFKKVQISNDYTKHVLETANRILEEDKNNNYSEKVHLYAEKSNIEKAMSEAEDSRFKTHTLSEEAFARVYPRFENQLKVVNKAISDLDKDHSHKVAVLERILALAENIGKTYDDAVYLLKRNYLTIFFKDFKIKKGKIVKYALTDDLKPLIESGSVRIASNGLPQWDTIRTEKWLRDVWFLNNSSNQVAL